MSSSPSTSSSRIAPLRTRLYRLGSDPRVRLLPEGPKIVGELADVVELVHELDLRVRTLERHLRGLMLNEDLGCDES